MKKKLLVLISCTLLLFCGCGKTYQEAIESSNQQDIDCFVANGYFTEIVSWNDIAYSYKIVYTNDTKVKYMIIICGDRFGITPLYNTDGTLQIYEGE